MTGETRTLCDIVTCPDVIFRYDARDRVRDRDRNRDRERNRDRDFRKRKNQRPLRAQYKVGEDRQIHYSGIKISINLCLSIPSHFCTKVLQSSFLHLIV